MAAEALANRGRAKGRELRPQKPQEPGRHAAEAVAHYSLTIKHLYKTAPWKFERLYLLSIYVSTTSAPRMDYNDRLNREQNIPPGVPG